MIHEKLHRQILQNHDRLNAWLISKKQGRYFPIYSSVDIRDSSFKLASVDANIYPAGFNNLCEVDRNEAPKQFKKYLDWFCGSEAGQKIALLTEEHTSNAFYWDNVYVLVELLTQAGRDVRVCIPRPMEGPVEVPTATGRSVKVYSAVREGDRIVLDRTFIPQLIISNNDFSDSYDWWAKGLSTPVVPARELGWYQRKKSTHFQYYNQLAQEFAEIAQIDPWVMTVETQLIKDFDVGYEESRVALAEKVDAMIGRIRKEYEKRGINATPTVFMKNNAGTYGLAVTPVQSGDEVRGWNAKNRKKMQAAKGGRDVSEVILQEGIPSSVTSEGITAEPVIYMVGCELTGGFLRTHSDKGPDESLNSPGAVYKKLCMSDLQIDENGKPFENVYGWCAKLSLLSIGFEAEAMGIHSPRPGVSCKTE